MNPKTHIAAVALGAMLAGGGAKIASSVGANEIKPASICSYVGGETQFVFQGGSQVRKMYVLRDGKLRGGFDVVVTDAQAKAAKSAEGSCLAGLAEFSSTVK